MDPHIQQLIDLQNCDEVCHSLEQELANIPREVQLLKNKMDNERAKLESYKKAIQETELKRKEVDQRLQETEQKIAKYQTQQLEVKKNEEYKALEVEITNHKEAVGVLEEEEIKVLMEIDSQNEVLREQQILINGEISEIEKDLGTLGEREQKVKAKLEDEKARLKAAETAVSEIYLSAYQRVKQMVKHFPVVCGLKDHRCQGCHLKVSHDVVTKSLRADELRYCDQCGRILYS